MAADAYFKHDTNLDEITEGTNLPPIEAKDYYAVMVHFYRGELGRIMIWRQRLDVTTNWAIVAASAMITFGLGSPKHTQLIFILANYIVLLLLFIEARRYRYYDAFRARVRMLEAHFIMPVMMCNSKLLQGDWKKVMSEDLLMPSFKISKLTAILRRFKRNYVWLFLMIYVSWVTKIWIDHPDAHSIEGYIDALLYSHSIRVELFICLVGSIFITFFFLLFKSLMMEQQSGEFSQKPMRRKKWMS